MSTHKSKLFKKVFEKNCDSHMGFEPTMSQETFVPLMGEMWAKAKAKYAAKHAEYMVFVTWLNDNYYINENYMYNEFGDIEMKHDKTLEQLYKIWKKEK